VGSWEHSIEPLSFMIGLNSSGSGQRTVAGSCQHSNETLTANYSINSFSRWTLLHAVGYFVNFLGTDWEQIQTRGNRCSIITTVITCERIWENTCNLFIALLFKWEPILCWLCVKFWKIYDYKTIFNTLIDYLAWSWIVDGLTNSFCNTMASVRNKSRSIVQLRRSITYRCYLDVCTGTSLHDRTVRAAVSPSKIRTYTWTRLGQFAFTTLPQLYKLRTLYIDKLRKIILLHTFFNETL
jgi:hypothetical protein